MREGGEGDADVGSGLAGFLFEFFEGAGGGFHLEYFVDGLFVLPIVGLWGLSAKRC